MTMRKAWATTGVAAAMICMTSAITPAFADSTGGMSTTPLMSATDLRVTLDTLLGEHAELAILAMEDGYSQSPAFNAVAAELSKNTDELSAAITAVYGEKAGQAFHQIWSAHIGFFVDYVQATAKQDKSGQQQALNKLAGYKQQFATFLAGANPNLDATTLENGLQTHITELVTTFNDYVNKDYTGAANEMVKAYNHMFMTGDLLASAIVKQFPSKFSGVDAMQWPSSNLRVALTNLLGEHANLAIQAMADGYAGAPDFSAVAAALGDNTNQLAAAIGSVYGSQAQAMFQKMWSAHIGYFVDYVKATATKNSAGQQAALNHLEQYKQQFSAFLASANPNLPASALAQGLQVHVNELVSTFQAAVNGRWNAWADGLVKSYNHMGMTAQGLAAGIGQQFSLELEAGKYSSWPQIHIYVGGTERSNPLAWLSVDTQTNTGSPWVPIWYVMYVLKDVGIHSTWNGTRWDMTLPQGWTAPAGAAQGSGSTQVAVNGKTVWWVHSTVTADPYSKVKTTYMSVADLNTLLGALKLQSSWNGVNWSISK